MVMSPLRFLLPAGVVLGLVMALAFAPNHGAASPTPAAAPAVEQHVPDAVLVKFRPGISSNVVSDVAVHHHVARMKPLPRIGVMEMTLSPSSGQPEAVVEALKRNPAVEYAELDYIVSAAYTPNDPYFTGGFSGTLQCRPERVGHHHGISQRLCRDLDTASISHGPAGQSRGQRELQ